MPYGKKPRADEIAQLAAWISSLKANQAATPASAKPARQRPVLSVTAEIENALKDLNSVNELDRQYIRYFSYRAQYNAVMGCETKDQFAKRLRFYQAGFNKLLNSLSYGPRLVLPATVGGSEEALVRVDLRDLKWSAADWDRMIGHYFYGVSPKRDPGLETLVRSTGTSLPVVRTDWFMSNASRPPLYNEFLRLPENVHALERDILRVDTATNIEKLDGSGRLWNGRVGRVGP